MIPILKRKFSMPNIFISNDSSVSGPLRREGESSSSSYISYKIMTHRQNTSKGHKNLVLATGIHGDGSGYSPEYSLPSDQMEFILPTSASSPRFNVGKKSTNSAGASGHTRPTTASPVNKKGKEKEKSKDTKKKTRSLNNLHADSAKELNAISNVSVELLRKWEASFNALLRHPDGLVLFEHFLVSEFSEENIQFWSACERYTSVPDDMVEKEATLLYEEYIAPQAPKLVNIDHQTTRDIIESMKKPNKSTFLQAQQSIYLLMARDSFVRFIKAERFQAALQKSGQSSSQPSSS